MKVEDENEIDIYFMLHRLEGITSDMKDTYRDTHANRINIVRHQNGMASRLIGHLASGEEYIQNDWSSTGQSLHIKVCSISDRYEDGGGAKVLVYLDGLTTTPSCDDGDDHYDKVTPLVTPIPSSTLSQTESPSSHQDYCEDSILKTKVNGIPRNCEWVGANKTQERCEKSDMASHCPLTCMEPLFCTADSGKRFQLKGTSEFQGCDWVGRKLTKQRCQIEGVASTCRETCASFH